MPAFTPTTKWLKLATAHGLPASPLLIRQVFLKEVTLYLFACFWWQAGAVDSHSNGEGSTWHHHCAPGMEGAAAVAGQGEGATAASSATFQGELQAYNMASIKLLSLTCKMQALARVFGNTEMLKDHILLSFLKGCV